MRTSVESAAAALGASPTGRWARGVIHRTGAGDMVAASAAMASHVIGTVTTGRRAAGGITVAIDKHDIPRHDGGDRSALNRGRRRGGTSWQETYMTAQCVDEGARAQICAVPFALGDRNAPFVREMMQNVRSRCPGVRLVMLDREFFSAGCVGALNASGVSYLMPCPNTPGVKQAIREYAAGGRAAVSDMVVARDDGTGARHAMTITRRKKKRKDDGRGIMDDPLRPEEEYIAFATNDPGLDPDEYEARWGIESGYASLERIRARTCSRDPVFRQFCFLYTIMVYNAWTLARWVLGPEGGEAPTLVVFMSQIAMGREYVRPPKPPP